MINDEAMVQYRNNMLLNARANEGFKAIARGANEDAKTLESNLKEAEASLNDLEDEVKTGAKTAKSNVEKLSEQTGSIKEAAAKKQEEAESAVLNDLSDSAAELSSFAGDQAKQMQDKDSTLLSTCVLYSKS